MFTEFKIINFNVVSIYKMLNNVASKLKNVKTNEKVKQL